LSFPSTGWKKRSAILSEKIEEVVNGENVSPGAVREKSESSAMELKLAKPFLPCVSCGKGSVGDWEPGDNHEP
jgi:hypothetical protein